MGETVSEEELDAAIDEELVGAGTKDSPADNETAVEEDAAPVEEEVVEGEVAEEVQETPEEIEHKDKSRQGRKLKRVEDTVEKLADTFNRYIESQTKSEDEEEEIDREMPISFNDLDAALDRREAKTRKVEEDYVDEYTLALADLTRDMTDAEAESVLKEHDKSHYLKSHTDPKVAAEKNFAAARIAILEGKVAAKPTKVNPLTGKKVDVPSGVGGGTRVDSSDTSKPLDDETLKLMKEMGLTAEEARDALEGEGSTTLTGE